jgi:crotonobetainyl-CoA:carnitine CoA-transferase CaiB-like acyl-CoA transferase
MIGSFVHPSVGGFPALKLPFVFEGLDSPTIGSPPLLGEHTDSILGELGYSSETIAALHQDGVV